MSHFFYNRQILLPSIVFPSRGRNISADRKTPKQLGALWIGKLLAYRRSISVSVRLQVNTVSTESMPEAKLTFAKILPTCRPELLLRI